LALNNIHSLTITVHTFDVIIISITNITTVLLLQASGESNDK
jgi:hypothetical protein